MNTASSSARPSAPVVAPIAFAASTLRTAELAARHQLRLADDHVGWRLRFADGTVSRVYRETVNDAPRQGEGCLLVVTFELRAVGRSRVLHLLFRLESILNTPLFAGFPGFRSKLWMAGESNTAYHGVYEWDGTELAGVYAETLGILLAAVCRPGTVRHHVSGAITPDRVLAEVGGPQPKDRAVTPAPLDSRPGDWWRIEAAWPGPS